MQIIAFDSHKHYTFARVENEDGSGVRECRIEHRRGNIQSFLRRCKQGSCVAVETIGNWYWIVDEIEQAAMVPKLVHARKAKLMLGCVNKTDKLDAEGLNRLQRVGTLPVVWIPPGDIRDKRDLPRTRMVFAVARTRLKNRIHSVVDKYGFQDRFEDLSDMFGVEGKGRLAGVIRRLPSQTRYTMQLLLEQLEQTESKIEAIEARMREVFEQTGQIQLLQSLPGVGPILSVVILQEIGDVHRFAHADRLTGYSGVSPRVHASGDKVRYGRLRPDANHYLKWAFSEAANSVVVNRSKYSSCYVIGLYDKIRRKPGHSTAIGALARHIAESAYWVLVKAEPYLERGLGSLTGA